MDQPPTPPTPDRLASFASALQRLIERHGGASPDLTARVAEAVRQLTDALAAGAVDGQGLTALSVVQIRAGKFAARCLPAALYQDPKRLLALRAELRKLALALLGDPTT